MRWRARFGHTPPAVARVRRRRPEQRLRQAQQVVLAHDPDHALVVDAPALASQQRADPAVAVVAVGQSQTLDDVAQRRFFAQRLVAGPSSVISCPADAGQPAHPSHRKPCFRRFALRARHRLDVGEDAVTPGPSLGRREPSICCKAPLKKSRSSCCWPTLRSSSAIWPALGPSHPPWLASRVYSPPQGPLPCAGARVCLSVLPRHSRGSDHASDR